MTPKEDALIWSRTANGVFSVKSGYQEEINSVFPPTFEASISAPISSSSIWKGIWSLDCHPKINLFWWKACSNAFSYQQRFILEALLSGTSLCRICGVEVESIMYMLFRCGRTREVFSCFSAGSNHSLHLACLGLIRSWKFLTINVLWLALWFGIAGLFG